MKKKMKRFVPTLLVMVLLAGMTVLAKEYSIYLSPGAISYTSTVTKGNGNQYTTIDTKGTDRIYVRYTVVNSSKSAVTDMAKIDGSRAITLNYNQKMTERSVVSLKMENNTTDNSGRFVPAAGTWTP